jgi:hypothetical protein
MTLGFIFYAIRQPISQAGKKNPKPPKKSLLRTTPAAFWGVFLQLRYPGKGGCVPCGCRRLRQYSALQRLRNIAENGNLDVLMKW